VFFHKYKRNTVSCLDNICIYYRRSVLQDRQLIGCINFSLVLGKKTIAIYHMLIAYIHRSCRQTFFYMLISTYPITTGWLISVFYCYGNLVLTDHV